MAKWVNRFVNTIMDITWKHWIYNTDFDFTTYNGMLPSTLLSMDSRNYEFRKLFLNYKPSSHTTHSLLRATRTVRAQSLAERLGAAPRKNCMWKVKAVIKTHQWRMKTRKTRILQKMNRHETSRALSQFRSIRNMNPRMTWLNGQHESSLKIDHAWHQIRSFK